MQFLNDESNNGTTMHVQKRLWMTEQCVPFEGQHDYDGILPPQAKKRKKQQQQQLCRDL